MEFAIILAVACLGGFVVQLIAYRSAARFDKAVNRLTSTLEHFLGPLSTMAETHEKARSEAASAARTAAGLHERAIEKLEAIASEMRRRQ